MTVKGWLRGEVLVRTRVEASGETEAAAAIIASRVSIDGSGGQVRAIGPEPVNNSWWSVSYEIFVPQITDLSLKTNNGGLTISDYAARSIRTARRESDRSTTHAAPGCNTRPT